MVGFDVGDVATIGCKCRKDASLSSASAIQVTTMARTRMNAAAFTRPYSQKSGPARFGINTGHHRGRCGFPCVRRGVPWRNKFASISTRRITGIRASPCAATISGYPRKLRWRRRPRWHHAHFRTMVKKIVAPGSSTAGSPVRR